MLDQLHPDLFGEIVNYLKFKDKFSLALTSVGFFKMTEPYLKKHIEKIEEKYTKKYPHLNSNDRLLFIYAKYGLFQQMKNIIAKGANVRRRIIFDTLNCGSYLNEITALSFITPLHLAAYGGHLSCVKYLVNAGASFKRNENECSRYSYLSPLHFAAAGGHINCVNYLLDQGASIHEETWSLRKKWGYSALELAIGNNDIECAQYLISRGALEKNICRYSMIRHSAWEGHLESLKLLISVGINVNAFDDDGRSPLSCAIDHYEYDPPRYAKCIQYLIQQGANTRVGHFLQRFMFSLPYAIYLDRLDLVKLLIEADPGLVHHRDRHPIVPNAIHAAVRYNNLNAIRLLLKYSVDLSIKNHYGKTVLMLARESGNEEMVALLAPYVSTQAVSHISL